MKKRIDIELDNPSKAEEIEVLTKIRDAVAGKDLYLVSLFTDDLVAWATKQIQDDVMPDLYAYYQDEIRTADVELGNFRKKLAEVEGKAESLQRELDEKAREMKVLWNQLKTVEEARDAAYEKYEEALATASSIGAEKALVEEEVVKLKARLYDLMIEKEER